MGGNESLWNLIAILVYNQYPHSGGQNLEEKSKIKARLPW